MKIDHLAIWCKDIERLKSFYVNYFQATSSERYVNPSKNFQSYFLSFESGTRLELMQKPGIPENKMDALEQFTGIIHFAISVGSKEQVNALTASLKTAGFVVAGEPRTTGDGYYESVVLDPEGNRIEITI